ncbi:DUF914-domain-containing protein [Basidiobolus meristosporus CBS 931.73]|uniref:DUF914-domain-containing protein n=1 Tax=Basidiobolus meristosporus CBS 931.73 TaxID=1314790 RepID=A0A1Y1X7M1_9FUNG|nr:DUF914-domain-containing protein [Basidiobolus meristosporus CBS 931.73]|eukprot:ORX81708.1 DUF914-domain-containing protein [Basidiobolus meristosporus CBS 931.73]
MDEHQVRPTIRAPFALLKNRRFLLAFALGQYLSLCTTSTSMVSTELATRKKVNIPTTQSFLVYLGLAVVYFSYSFYKIGLSGVWENMKKSWWKYLLLAVMDVEANYFTVKAFQYTSMLSIMLLDVWAIPVVMVLSFLLLKTRYRLAQYVGVAAALVGIGLLILSDVLANRVSSDGDSVKGDLFCLLGATLYGFTNVTEEYFIRSRPLYEVIGMLGFFGTIVNGIQLVILERSELVGIVWDGETVGLIIIFSILLFSFYSVAPILFRLSSSTFFNISMLTSDFYGLILGLIVYHYTIHWLYPIAYVVIICSIIIYNLTSASTDDLAKRHDHTEPA